MDIDFDEAFDHIPLEEGPEPVSSTDHILRSGLLPSLTAIHSDKEIGELAVTLLREIEWMTHSDRTGKGEYETKFKEANEARKGIQGDGGISEQVKTFKETQFQSDGADTFRGEADCLLGDHNIRATRWANFLVKANSLRVDPGAMVVQDLGRWLRDFNVRRGEIKIEERKRDNFGDFISEHDEEYLNWSFDNLKVSMDYALGLESWKKTAPLEFRTELLKALMSTVRATCGSEDPTVFQVVQFLQERARDASDKAPDHPAITKLKSERLVAAAGHHTDRSQHFSSKFRSVYLSFLSSHHRWENANYFDSVLDFVRSFSTPFTSYYSKYDDLKPKEKYSIDDLLSWTEFVFLGSWDWWWPDKLSENTMPKWLKGISSEWAINGVKSYLPGLSRDDIPRDILIDYGEHNVEVWLEETGYTQEELKKKRRESKEDPTGGRAYAEDEASKLLRSDPESRSIVIEPGGQGGFLVNKGGDTYNYPDFEFIGLIPNTYDLHASIIRDRDAVPTRVLSIPDFGVKELSLGNEESICVSTIISPTLIEEELGKICFEPFSPLPDGFCVLVADNGKNSGEPGLRIIGFYVGEVEED